MDAPSTAVVADETAARVLRRAGYRVIDAADGVELIEKIKQIRPDVAVVDMAVPRMGGLDVCRQLLASRCATLVLLIAAGADSADRVEGLRAGADDVLARPYDPEELKARVEALLRRRARPDARTPVDPDTDREPLTGLPNQRWFTRQLEEALGAAAAASQPLSLMAIVLDGFAAVNGRFGRSAGDRLLIECARSIVRACRDEDFVAHAAGDEFVVLLNGVHFAGCILYAERVWREIQATAIVEGGSRVSCATSIGVASYPARDIETSKDLLRFAHAALARAKAEGHGICLYQHHGYLFQPTLPDQPR